MSVPLSLGTHTPVSVSLSPSSEGVPEEPRILPGKSKTVPDIHQEGGRDRSGGVPEEPRMIPEHRTKPKTVPGVSRPPPGQT
eukprot:2693070-Rhodomonas_salina.2